MACSPYSRHAKCVLLAENKGVVREDPEGVVDIELRVVDCTFPDGVSAPGGRRRAAS